MIKKIVLLLLTFVAVKFSFANTQPIEIVVPFVAGGGSDIIGREISKILTNNGYPAIVVNKSGVQGRLGTQYVAKQADPANTLLILPPGPGLYEPILTNNAMYDVLADFEPIVIISTFPEMIVVPYDSKYQTLDELVADLKKNNNKLTWGHSVKSHKITGFRFLEQINSTAVDVPFNGAAQLIQALIGNHMDYAVLDPTGAMTFIESKRMRALGVTSHVRIKQLPDVPTMLERGINLESIGWFSVVGRKGIPDQLVKSINRVINRHMLENSFTSMNTTPMLGSPEDAKKFIRNQYRVMAPVITRYAEEPTK